MGKSKKPRQTRAVFATSLCLLGLAGWCAVSSPLTAATDPVDISETASAKSTVTYWKISTGAENPTINLETENVPIDRSFAGTTNTDNIVPRTNNSSVMNTQFTTGWLVETEHDDAGKSHDDQESYDDPTTNQHPYKFNSDTVDYSQTKVLSYEIHYDGGNGILVYAGDNAKLYYATEKPTTGESKFSWRLAEHKVSVPVTATYTYTQLHEADDDSLTYQFPDTSTTPNRWVSFYDYFISADASGSIPADTESFTKPTTAKWLFWYGVTTNGATFPNPFSTTTSTKSKVYVNSGTDWVYTKVYNDQEDIGVSKEAFLANSLVYATTETITYTDTIDFYFIDTSYIIDSQKDTNVYLRSDTHPEFATEMYTFYQTRNQKIKVKYKRDTGFTVTGLSKSYDAQAAWKNNLDNKTDYVGNEYDLLWKTKQMVDWNHTSINTINEDIDISKYEENGTTLYFMDAYNPVSIVKVTIPKIAASPTLSLNMKDEASIKGLKPNSYQIRVWVPLSNDTVPSTNVVATASGIVGYVQLPTSIASLPDGITAAADSDFWYDFNGGTSGTDKTILLTDLADTIANATNSRIPAMYIECRSKETTKKAASAIGTLYINEQQEFSDTLSSSIKVKVAEGQLTITDADKDNQYEYLVDGDTKWTTISSKTTTSTKFTKNTNIKIRKKSITTSDGTIILPSTIKTVTVPSDGTTKSYSKSDFVTTTATPSP